MEPRYLAVKVRRKIRHIKREHGDKFYKNVQKG
jgi:hypothetical protein